MVLLLSFFIGYCLNRCYISIPIWSYYYATFSSPYHIDLTKFQSQYGLIIIEDNELQPIIEYRFQSQYGLIIIK